MASSNPIVVGGGIQSGAPFALGNLVYVTNVSPPQLSGLNALHVVDSVSGVAYISVANSAVSYPAETNATETFRVKGGIIVTGSGTDSVQIGRGARATTNLSVVIGATAADNGQQGVVIGFAAVFNNAGGVCIGTSAVVGGNAGSAGGIAIGANASAVNSNSGGGYSIAIGDLAVAKQQDTVIGFSASSSVQNVLGNSNIVIGTLASINVGQGAGVSIGSSSSIGAKAGVAIGQGATIATGINNVAIGQVAKINSTATGCVIVGQGSVLSSSGSVIIGSGGVDLGAGVMQLGAANTNIATIVIGQGDTAASPGARTIRFTNASGLNNPASGVTFIAPLSTGNATPATMTFQTGVAIGSSSTLQTAATAMQLDGSVTAGTTRMLLYTQDTGTVQRVQTITNAATQALGGGLAAGRILYVPA